MEMSLQPQDVSLAWVFGLLLLGSYGLSLVVSLLSQSKVPLVGVRSKFEPGLISNFRFYRHAGAILTEGYTKVRIVVYVGRRDLMIFQFRNNIFQFTRADTDMLVLPPKYVNDLRMLPSTVASPTVAHVHNLMGSHTNMNIILRNNLHFRTLQLKLTPNLSYLTGPMQDELNFAIDKELPDCQSMYCHRKPPSGTYLTSIR